MVQAKPGDDVRTPGPGRSDRGVEGVEVAIEILDEHGVRLAPADGALHAVEVDVDVAVAARIVLIDEETVDVIAVDHFAVDLLHEAVPVLAPEELLAGVAVEEDAHALGAHGGHHVAEHVVLRRLDARAFVGRHAFDGGAVEERVEVRVPGGENEIFHAHRCDVLGEALSIEAVRDVVRSGRGRAAVDVEGGVAVAVVHVVDEESVFHPLPALAGGDAGVFHDQRAAADQRGFEVGLLRRHAALAAPFSRGLFFIAEEEGVAGNRLVRRQFEPGTFGEVEAHTGGDPRVGQIEDAFLDGDDAGEFDFRTDGKSSGAGLDQAAGRLGFDDRLLPTHARRADLGFVN